MRIFSIFVITASLLTLFSATLNSAKQRDKSRQNKNYLLMHCYGLGLIEKKII